MSVHRLYPDFFSFLDRMGEHEPRWKTFENVYFSKHREFLSSVWFRFQGFTEDNIRQRVSDIRKNDYAELRDTLGRCDIGERTRAAVRRCRAVSGMCFPCEVFLFIGFFSPDAFVATCGGSPVVGVGLERFRTFRHYHLLIAHEFCHLLLFRHVGETPPGAVDRAVREGISAHFSRLVFPGEREHTYLFMKEGPFRELAGLYGDIEAVVRELKRSGDEGSDLFHGTGAPVPPRAGYYFGARMVGDFVERRSITHIRELVACYEDIFVDFGLR